MDLEFSAQDLAFRDEVRAFLADKLTARLREGASVDQNAVPLARFLSVPPDVATKLAQTPYLFSD